MIGQSTSSDEQQQQQQQQQQQHLKRRALEELCDEVCGHQHSRQPLTKRPRLADLQFLEHDLTNLQYEPFDNTHHHHHHHHNHNHHWHEPESHKDHYHHHHHHHQEAPVTRLEVLVVDGTWDDALESFEAAAVGQTCGVAPLTELTSPTQAALQQQPLQDPLANCGFPDDFWNQQQQQHQQQQQTTTMPRLTHHQHQHQVENVRPRAINGFNAPPTYEDQENGNLSWLLDFKLDSLIEAPEERSMALLPRDLQGSKNKFNGTSSNNNNYNNNNNNNSVVSNKSSPSSNTYLYNDTSRKSSFAATESPSSSSSSPYNNSLADNRNLRPIGPKKPPFTYTELIEHALQERGELTVSAIYQWISEHFPYYKSNDDRWKNSVRHNLSINPHFRKGSKAPHGAGHLWAIASQDEGKSRQLFNIASIRQALQKEEAMKNNAHNAVIDEVAAATASIAQPPEEENIVDSITLEHCAEQILSGIKREVEVQYLVPMMVSGNGEHMAHNQQSQQNNPTDPLCPLKETDFLNPVSKEVVAEECGLIGEGYLVTDLNPSSLGLNMAESEVVTTDNLFGEELSFQFYEFATASQLQSA